MQTKLLGLIFLGGGLGSLTRYLLQVAGPEVVDGVDLVTFTINVAGAFLLGLTIPWLERTSARLNAFVGPGFLGGFTTFSALTVFPIVAARDGATFPALGYFGGTLLAGFLLAWAGLQVGKRLQKSRRP